MRTVTGRKKKRKNKENDTSETRLGNVMRYVFNSFNREKDIIQNVYRKRSYSNWYEEGSSDHKIEQISVFGPTFVTGSIFGNLTTDLLTSCFSEKDTVSVSVFPKMGGFGTETL